MGTSESCNSFGLILKTLFSLSKTIKLWTHQELQQFWTIEKV
jgi:hypothetical protein